MRQPAAFFSPPPRLPNNHLQYAVTWYGLALVLVVAFAIWARRRDDAPVGRT